MLYRIYKDSELNYVYEGIELTNVRKILNYDSDIDLYKVDQYIIRCDNIITDEHHSTTYTVHTKHHNTIKTLTKEEVKKQYYETYDEALNVFMKEESKKLSIYNNIEKYINKIQDVLLSYDVICRLKNPSENYDY